MKTNVKYLISALFLSLLVTSCNKVQLPGDDTLTDNDLKVTSVVLDAPDVTLDIGQSVTLTPTIFYKDDVAVEVTKTWRSSVTRVAEVDQEGKVTAKASGTTFITFMAGIRAAGCKVTVAGGEEENPDTPTPQPEDGFSITLSSNYESLEQGQSFNLTATLSEEAEVSWKTSDSTIAALSAETGLTVTINAGVAGKATISAEATSPAGNKHTVNCIVNVKESGGGEDDDKDVTIYFFLDFNNIDEDDETGTKLIKKFDWYSDKPISEAGALVPADPTSCPDPAFPNFIGWSDHTLIDTKNDLWNLTTDTVIERAGNTDYLYLYGIWSDVTKEAFTK